MFALSATRHHYIGDAVGTISVTLTDSGSFEQSAFKDVFGVDLSTPLNEERYAGLAQRERDMESGLDYMRARMYDPRLGRFTQTDPLPQNRPVGHYVYASNNPISLSDPTGLQGEPGKWQETLQDEWHDPNRSAGAKAWTLTKTFGYSLWNTLSFGALNRQDKLVDKLEEGKITQSEYNRATAVNGAGSAVTAVATISTGGVAAPTLGATVLVGAGAGVVSATGGQVTEDLTTLASGKIPTTTTADYLKVQGQGAATGAVLAGAGKVVVTSLAQPHGNSATSTKPQHLYEIYEIATGKVAKTGISGTELTGKGTSPRATEQVNDWNRQAGYEKYGQRIVEKDIPVRQEALDKEKANADRLRSQGELDPEKHKRP